VKGKVEGVRRVRRVSWNGGSGFMVVVDCVALGGEGSDIRRIREPVRL
jgi:hypothetical protein